MNSATIDCAGKVESPAAIATKLRELGFTATATLINAKEKLRRQLSVAYEHYRFVTPEILQRFQEELRAKTLKGGETAKIDNHFYPLPAETYDTLRFTPIARYGLVPPPAALEKLAEARMFGCFDDFEVADLKTVAVRPDPILFGVIIGCPDKFFIVQWDNDVKIEDILRADEG